MRSPVKQSPAPTHSWLDSHACPKGPSLDRLADQSAFPAVCKTHSLAALPRAALRPVGESPDLPWALLAPLIQGHLNQGPTVFVPVPLNATSTAYVVCNLNNCHEH